MTSALAARAKQGFPETVPNGLSPTFKRETHRPGLDIQPFLLAIAACLPDLHNQLRSELYTGRSRTYQQDSMAINTLERSMTRAGFAFTGRKLSSQPPQAHHLVTIGQAAERCISLMGRRYDALLRSGDVTAYNDFCEKSSLYQQAMNTLRLFKPDGPRPDPLPIRLVITDEHVPALA